MERDHLWSYARRPDAEARGCSQKGKAFGVVVYAVEIDTAVRSVGEPKILAQYGAIPPFPI